MNTTQTHRQRAVAAIVQNLYALDEPWRSRFLTLVAQKANDWHWNGREPDHEEVVSWLLENLTLQREVDHLLRNWTSPRTRRERWAC